jgi:hypothetical protein
MATSTCSVYLREPKALHSGLNVLIGQWDDATISTGDIIKLAKLPDRAVLVSGGVYRSEPGGDLTLRARIPMTGASGTASSTVTTLLASTASGSVDIGADLLNYQFSISDAVIVREIELELVNASASTTGTVKFHVEYTLDDRA